MTDESPTARAPGTPAQVYLIGLRASGKSTVGRLVAQRFGGTFVDLDDITPGLLGESTSADALRRHGVADFREAERRALEDPRVRTAQVVALGGGTPTHPPCEAELRRRAESGAAIVYLRASAACLRARLSATDLATRPALLGADVLAEVEALWQHRDPIYRALATLVVDVEAMTPEAAAEAAIARRSQIPTT